MGCGPSTNEGLVTHFWHHIHLRNDTPKEYYEHVQRVLNNKNIDDEHYHEKEFVDKVLANSEHKDLSRRIFANFKRTHPLHRNKYLAALFFLARRDKHDAKLAFIDLLKLLNLNVLENNEKGEISIQKTELAEILALYVNLISLYGISTIKEIAGDEYFESTLTQVYSHHHQKIYLERLLNNYKGKLVPLNNFFDNEYLKVANDALVRDALYAIGLEEQRRFTEDGDVNAKVKA